MTNSKAPWLTRGGAIALMAAAGIALAACSGGGGLNEDESAALQERLDTAEADTAEALVAQKAAEAAEKAAQAEKVTAEAEKLKAETEKTAAEIAKAAADDARDAAVAVAQDAQKAAEAAAASAKQAAAALVEAKAAEEQAKVDQKAAEDEAAEAERLRRLAVAAADTEEQRRQQAEAEKDRLEQVAEDAQQQANRAKARTALIGLGGLDATAADAGTVSPVTPRYRMTALVTTNPAVTFGNPQRSSSGRWSITTLSKSGSTHNDKLVVYSDMGAPTRVLITEHGDYMSRFVDVPDTSRISATIAAADAERIASSQFPRGGLTKTFEPTIDSDHSDIGGDANSDGNLRNDYDTVRFSGSFDGASGTFECMGDMCTIEHQGGNRYIVSANNWSFTTSKTARVSVDDDSYMYFGWWRRVQLDDESFSYDTFSGGMYPVSGGGFDDLVGSATYNGPAVGQYAIYQPADSDSGTGSFTAQARLEADFDTNMLSGQVTNFSNASNWTVTLNKASMQGGNVDDDTGTVSWVIGSRTEDGGMWDARFFSDVTPYAGHIPEGVVGDFTAQFGEVGRLTGAFGAHCPTSTCPR